LKQTSAHPQLASTEQSVESAANPASKSIGQQLTELENQTKSIRKIDLTTTGSISKMPEAEVKPTPIKLQNTTDAKFHVVQPGDTLSAIGRKFKIKTSEIMELNSIENARLIKPGMKLIVSK
jgi:LysM repeat protein